MPHIPQLLLPSAQIYTAVRQGRFDVPVRWPFGSMHECPINSGVLGIRGWYYGVCSHTNQPLFELPHPPVTVGQEIRLCAFDVLPGRRARISRRTGIVGRCTSLVPHKTRDQSDERPIPHERATWVWRIGIEVQAC